MSNVSVKFIEKGFKDILKGNGVKNLVEETANSIQSKAGTGFKANVKIGKYGGGRYVGFVSSTDSQSARAESERKVLSKAVKG